LRRVPNFVLLRAFEAAARLESFAMAAEELHLTPSAISHQVKELEQFVGRALFFRRHRRVELTPEGNKLARDLEGIFDAIEAACANVSGTSNIQTLSIHAAPSFATKWLGPRLRYFIDAHPSITMRMSSGADPVDLLKDRSADITISYSRVVRRPGITVHPLGKEEIHPMCSPALLEKFGSMFEALSKLTLIESPLSRVSWAEWFELNGITAPAKPRLSFDRASLGISAAVDGMGIVLETTRLAEQELNSGALVRVTAPGLKSIERETHFVSLRTNERETPRIKAFLEWLLDVASRPSAARHAVTADPSANRV
jgi:LysR family glycine cleavage system transcriptional activator